jgi:transcription elongation factor Elf1
MPKKGVPRCNCGWAAYTLVYLRENSAIIVCKNCGKKRKTRSLSALRHFKELNRNTP